ncbi:hypothetical protein CEXT_652021 [Caerostris extrusa]|uniref:Uncharacterized protein n=1 Tax=Caerostris extrusa TaxID=172846 RepID=A0AAV4WTS9_CAEEX|nr:hypothetical protein CEXT_652021 [Caerostris extrusa]
MLRFGLFTFGSLSDLTAAHITSRIIIHKVSSSHKNINVNDETKSRPVTAKQMRVSSAASEETVLRDLAAGRPKWGAFRHSPALIGYAWRHLVMSASFRLKPD